MTCTRYRELISRYVDGEVTPRQRREVLAHVERCHDCAAWLARARQADVILRGVPETHPSDRVRAAVLGAASDPKNKLSLSSPAHRAHLPALDGLRLYTAELLLRFNILPQRLALTMAVALLSILGVAYWLNILPPVWGYSKFGFLFPHDQEQAAATSTPMPAISSGYNGHGGPVAVPNVLLLSPMDNAQEVSPTISIRVGFDLPMDRASVEAAVKIDPPVAGNFKWNYDNEVSFTPSGAGLLRGISYTVSLSDTARSLAGTRIAKPLTWSFATHNTYSVVSAEIPGTAVPITGSFTLLFDVPMDTALAPRAVSLRANGSSEDIIASYRWDTAARRLTVSPLSPMPATAVTLRVGAQAATRSGDTLGRGAEFTYAVTLPEPRLRIVDGRLRIARAGSASPIRYELTTGAGAANSGQPVQLRAYVVPGEQLSALGVQARDWPLPLPDGFPGKFAGAGMSALLHLSQLTNPDSDRQVMVGQSPGVYLLVSTANTPSGPINDWQLLVLTDRDITRTGDNSPFWLTDNEGKPWSDAEVSLYTSSGALVEKGVSDAAGLWLPATMQGATLAIARDLQGHIAALTLDPKAATQQNNANSALDARLETDQPAYYPGEQVNFRAVARGQAGQSPENSSGVSVQLLNPAGMVVSALNLKPDSVGGVSGLFNLASALRAGQYTIRTAIGPSWHDFPLTVREPRNDTLSVYVAPTAETSADGTTLTYTVSVLGPHGEPAQGGTLTATLGIFGDRWSSEPLFVQTDADGRASVVITLPGWGALYRDPDIYLHVRASWGDFSGDASAPLDIAFVRPLLAGVNTLASPSLDLAAVVEPQQDGMPRLRLVTLDVNQESAQGFVLVKAVSPSGASQHWAINLAGAGGDITLPLPSDFAGCMLRLYRAGVSGSREMALPPAVDAPDALSVSAPDTVMPGAPLPVALQLSSNAAQGQQSEVSIWFRRVAADLESSPRGWEPSASTGPAGALTSTVMAPTSPGLWYVMAGATAADGTYHYSRTVVTVLPGPTLQLPTVQQLQLGVPQALAIAIYNPLSTSLASGVLVEHDGSVRVDGSSSQGINVPAGGWQRIQWNFNVNSPEDGAALLSFLPSAGVRGTWKLPFHGLENPRADINYAAGVLSNQRTVGVLVPSGLPESGVQLEIRASTSLLAALSEAAGTLSIQSSRGSVAWLAAQLSSAPAVASAYRQTGSGAPASLASSTMERPLILQELYASQHDDGGWGASLDPADGPSTLRETSDVLLAMRRQTLAWPESDEPQPAIDNAVVSRALAYVGWQVGRPIGSYAVSSMLDDQLRALYVMALYGSIKSDAVRPFITYASKSGHIGNTLSPDGAAWLALALWQTGDSGDAMAVANALMPNDGPKMSDAGLAAMLDTMVAVSSSGWQGKNAPDTSQYRSMASQYVRMLMEDRHGLLWSSPSASADALWALSRYAAQQPDKALGEAQITLNDNAIQAVSRPDSPGNSSAVLSGSVLHAGTNWLRLQPPTNQTLYYSLILRATR